MDHTDIISVDQVSMRFALASEKVDSLKEYFIKTLKSQISTNEFWALRMSLSISSEEMHWD